MTDTPNTDQTQPGADARPEGGEAPDSAPDSAPKSFADAVDGSDPAAGLAALEGHLAKIDAERAELKDRLLRMLAEAENLKKRTQREVADARKYAVTSFARDMLNVGDNLSRALDAVGATDDNPALKTLVEGVEMTARELDRALSKHGVAKLEPEGERFDANFHQAMFEVPNPEVASGTVVQVLQAGYTIGERVLRPAMVGVAKGGPAATAAAAPEPAGENIDTSFARQAPEDEAPDAPGHPGVRVDRSV